MSTNRFEKTPSFFSTLVKKHHQLVSEAMPNSYFEAEPHNSTNLRFCLYAALSGLTIVAAAFAVGQIIV